MPSGSMATAHHGYVETDPTGRYGRFKEVLGKGAVKTVYKAFDEVQGMEVAWNQVFLNDTRSSPDDLQRLFAEVRLLKNLDHESIMKYITSWIDAGRHTFNFITEMFTSGSLRSYRQKHKQVSIRAIKTWSRQILRGLSYLHSRSPPVIHRDLKCDNVFVNGHLGQVKIGDLGLAAILNGAKHAHSVIGTPEFMAPELYDEDYDELVDVYAFGMCVLEMLTSEYPYSECSNPAQIYKKVSSGKLPEAFDRISDVEGRSFVGKCLEKVEKRLPARELLLDPFLAEEETSVATDMTITGTMNPEEDDTIHLKVQICDNDGSTRNVHFPFDINNDTAMDVAIEMVKELEITDLEATDIARMIEDEIFNLLPKWRELIGAACSSGASSNHSTQGESDTYLADDVSPRSSVASFRNMTLNYSSSGNDNGT